MNQKIISFIHEAFIITGGTAVVACAVFFFLMPNHLAVGSISGLAIILANLLPLQVSTITLFLNIFFLLLGILLIGKEFGIKTIITSLLLPVFLAGLEYLFPDNQSIFQSSFIDMIFFVFTVSLGISVLFHANASSGGLDIAAKILNKYFHIDLGKALAYTGIVAALLSVTIYDIETVLISILGTYLQGIVLDHFIFGFNIKRRVCIISQKTEEIQNFVLHTLHSGASLYSPVGAYDKKIHEEIIVIVDRNEYPKLITFISHADPNAFVTVYNVSEVFYRPKCISLKQTDTSAG